jgi:hypothetical protein
MSRNVIIYIYIFVSVKKIPFVYNRTKILGTLHEDLSMFHLLVATLSRHKSALFKSSGIRPLG